MMGRWLLITLIALSASGLCYADSLKGSIDKVDLKTYEITVNGKRVNVSKALVFTENEMNVTKNVIIRDLKDHKGDEVVCYGTMEKDDVFNAYKVRVFEVHR